MNGGDAGGDAPSKLEELRVNAGIKGMAWLQEEVDGMKWPDLQKAVQGTGLTDDDAQGLLAKLKQLRAEGLREGKKRFRKVVSELEDGELQALSAAAGLQLADGSGKSLSAAKDRSDDFEGIGARLWFWVSRCSENDTVLGAQLLMEAVKANRIGLLSILTGKCFPTVEGLHLSDDSLCVRVVEATLPLLASIEAANSRMPRVPPGDLFDAPGMFDVFEMGSFLRRQSIALLSCLLSSIGSVSKEKLGWICQNNTRRQE
eukprot:s301_g15.t1